MRRFSGVAAALIALAIVMCPAALRAGYTYTLDASNQATITKFSGSGDVVIPSSLDGYPVVAIGDYAFSNLSGITSVTIPEGVTSIGEGAFYYCTYMTSVTLPNSLTSIGMGAFDNCVRLTSITIPDSVTSLGTYAFYGCMSLTSVTIGSGVTTIGDYAFYYCQSLTSVVIPNSVTSIGNYAFYNCTKLASVMIGNGVTSIGDYAFRYCTSLTGITIPGSVKSIGAYAFHYCNNLTSATIGSGVTSIGTYAFSNCTALTSIAIPDSVTSLGTDAFYNCTSMTSATIGSGLTSIGNFAFQNCTKLASVKIDSGTTSIGNSMFNNCKALTSITIPDSVTIIGDSAFLSCSALTSITIPDSVTTIQNAAFYNCTKLASVTLGSGLTSIWISSFKGCTALTSVTIPDSVTSIGDSAFQSCTALTDVTIGTGITSIVKSAFDGCTNLAVAKFEGNAPTMGSTVFDSAASGFYVYYPYGGIGFTSPTWEGYPSQYYQVYSYSLDGNGNATITDYTGAGGDITIPSTIDGYAVTGIGALAFYNCTNLTSVTIPDGVTSLGMGAFCGCTGLPNVTIPASVTGIGDYAFYGCTNLALATFQGSAPTMGSEVFDYTTSSFYVSYPYGANGFTETIWEGYPSQSYQVYTYSGPDAGGNITITASSGSGGDITIPTTIDSYTVTGIDAGAFKDMTSLTSVTIPAEVTSLGNSAFEGCTSLRTAIFLGDKPVMGDSVFDGTATGFRIYYYSDATGSKATEWGYDSVAYQVNKVTDGGATEGEGVVHTVTFNYALTRSATFDLSLAGVTATIGTDTGAVTFGKLKNASGNTVSGSISYDGDAGTITVPANLYSFSVTVPTVSDSTYEGNETYALTVDGTSGTGTITDNARSVVSVSSQAVTEGEDAVHTVTLSGTTPEAETYSFSLTGNTATIGTDTGAVSALTFSDGVAFTNATNTTITVPAGVTTFTVTVPTVSDLGKESTETYTLTVYKVSGIGTLYDLKGYTSDNPFVIDSGNSSSSGTLNDGSDATPYYYEIDSSVDFGASDLIVGNTTAGNTLTLNGAEVTIDTGCDLTIGKGITGEGDLYLDNGSILEVGGNLCVGRLGSGELEIGEDSLVVVDGTASTGTNGTIYLNGGYLALKGEYTTTQVLAALTLYVWDGNDFVTADTTNVLASYIDSGAQTSANTYLYDLFGDAADLNGYTVISYTPADMSWTDYTSAVDYWLKGSWYGAIYYEPDYGNVLWNAKQGWQYSCAGNTEEASYFWDYGTSSWWHTGKEVYPWMFQFQYDTASKAWSGSWYLYESGASPNRIFYNCSTNCEVNESAIAH